MYQNVRYALRTLWQGRVWNGLVVLALAIGIGANTAAFSATSGLFLRPLSVHAPDSLVRFRHAGRNDVATDVGEYGNRLTRNGAPVGSTFSYEVFQELQHASTALSDVFAVAPMTATLVANGQANVATTYIATGNFLSALGVQAVLGRLVVASDDRHGAPPVAAISEAAWARLFGRDPSVIGRVVRVNNASATIVGVLPATFTGIQSAISEVAPDIVLPLAMDSLVYTVPVDPSAPMDARGRTERPTYWWLQIGGRLSPGASVAQAEASLQQVFQATARQVLATHLASLTDAERRASDNEGRTDVPTLIVESATRGMYDGTPETARAVTLISTVTGLILMLVCAGVANLLLARGAARRHDIAVRLSLGATGAQVVRQLILESVLLSAAGGAAGLLVATWGRALLPEAVSRGPLDWRVLLFTIAVSVTTGLVFGLLPARQALRRHTTADLKDGARTVVATRTALGHVLLGAQVSICVVLLVGAGLFLRTILNLRAVNVGFDAENLVVFRLNPLSNAYDQTRSQAVFDLLSERLGHLPGVEAVTMMNPPLLSGRINTTGFVRQGNTAPLDNNLSVLRVRVAPNFFDVLGIPLLRGRTFTDRDGRTAPNVAVINHAAARRFFGTDDAVGQRFGRSPETSADIEVVGIVRDAMYTELRDASPPTIYVPYQQSSLDSMAFAVRAGGDPAALMPAIRDTMRGVDATLPLLDFMTQRAHIERRFVSERLYARAFLLFGGLALLVAGIGLFGIVSFNVTQRTHEIGVRMALGADAAQVRRMVIREAMTPVAIGALVGVLGALGIGRLVQSLLFGLAPTDPATVVGALLLLGLVSVAASGFPAARAARVEPMVALRTQ